MHNRGRAGQQGRRGTGSTHCKQGREYAFHDGERLGGRELDVLDRDDALALLAHLAELACCCAPALGAAPLPAGADEPNGRAGEAAARRLRRGAGGGGGGALPDRPGVT